MTSNDGYRTKRAAILAAWDRGERQYSEIARQAGSTVSGVRTCLSVAGRLAGRMRNGPSPIKGPRILEMWRAGERDLEAIGAEVGSDPSSVRAQLQRAGIPLSGIWREFSGESSRIPMLMLSWARERGRDPVALAEKILKIVSDEDMYAAVLDE